MWDVLREGVLGADGGDTDVRGLAGLGEGVVAAVEVFALLQMEGRCQRNIPRVWTEELRRRRTLASKACDEGTRKILWRQTHLELVLQKVFGVGHLAIEAEDLLLLLREFLLTPQG